MQNELIDKDTEIKRLKEENQKLKGKLNNVEEQSFIVI